jgi:2-iminobutanoate/2-iminopropanoate deaminase
MKPRGKHLGVISTDKAPKAIGPYSQAIAAGETIYTAGQIALDPKSGEIVGTTAAEQAEQVLQNLAAILDAAGTSLGNVVKTTVFLVDMADFPAVNDVYARHFGTHRPARSTVQAAALPKGVRVEIDAVAVRV